MIPRSDTDLGLTLLALTRQFIKDKNIHCEETIYQSDRVIRGAYEFIHELCDVTGYKEFEDE